MDPLSRHYTLISDANETRFQCNVCQSEIGRKEHFKRHLLTQHPGTYSDEWEMTQECLDLKSDFLKLGMPTDVELEFRKHICFHYDRIANRPSFLYEILDGNLWNAVDVAGRTLPPSVDKWLPKENQMRMNRDFKNVLPPGYEMGHLSARKNHYWSAERRKCVELFSTVAIQHRNLNQNLWTRLEQCAQSMTIHYKVRTLSGVAGELFLDYTSRSKVPRWWYKVILSSDHKDQNWQYSAFIFPNKECTGSLLDYRTSIYNVRDISEYDFFENIIQDLQTTGLDIAEDQDDTFKLWESNKWFSDIES